MAYSDFSLREVCAKLFNEQNQTPLSQIYGCVTTGDEWLFLRLDEKLTIDRRKYFLNELGELLSVFHSIVKNYQ